MRHVSIHLSQNEINAAMRVLIERKLHEAGVNVSEDTARTSYFLVICDPPLAVGCTEITSRAGRDGNGTRLTYVIKE
jgi:hypothetical protein